MIEMKGLRTTKSNLFRICVVTFPLNDSGLVILSNLIKVLERLSDEIIIIAGVFPENRISPFDKKIHIKNVEYSNKKRATLIKIIDLILAQLRMSINLVKFSRKFSIVIFFLGNQFLLPMLFANLLRKKIIVASAGSVSKSAKEMYKNGLFGYWGIPFSCIAGLLEKINYILSKKIIVYSERLIEDYGLEKHKNKISIAHEHFLDFNNFRVQKKIDEKDNIVGYIGRLSEEKGVLNFVKAIPEILEEQNEIRFLIGGDGQLRDKIEKYLDEKNLNSKVKLVGWIHHDELPEYLNELKLIVLPSYTEGLPNIMLEAMACGTPVLATQVGAIPDIIQDGETGFILENNSSECIARNVIRALEHPNLNEIVDDARKVVEKEYTYEAAVEKYRGILEKI